jgi:shikimate dehydrogenase
MRRPGRLVLLGHPVDHSLSPRLQNAALEALGIPLRYEAIDVPPAQLTAHLETLRGESAAGNVTIPHKSAVLRVCSHLSDTARRVGAINVFRTNADGELEGGNTDVDGFDALVRAALGDTPSHARVALLGAGGGASAVLGAVERWQAAEVRVYNRSQPRASALVERFAHVATMCETAAEAVRGANVVVNATSIGMRDDHLPVTIESLPPGAAVLDLVYRKGGTPLVRDARAAGFVAEDGTEMLLEQGALAFEFWLEREAPREVMRAALA